MTRGNRCFRRSQLATKTKDWKSHHIEDQVKKTNLLQKTKLGPPRPQTPEAARRKRLATNLVPLSISGYLIGLLNH